ncbi:hypothetical protein, partial [Variovorax sp. N23]|uniref:hypothetical protein n=1 Tax=Variovorax sp. N23 TaxID=2980555 RepID=UPI0021CA9BD5
PTVGGSTSNACAAPRVDWRGVFQQPVKTVKIESVEQAKQYVLKATSQYLSSDEVRDQLEHYKRLSERMKADAIVHQTIVAQIEGLTRWSQSQAFQDGAYAQGIDSLMLDLVELRAMVYALQHVTLERDPFKEYVFHAQWLVGCAYSMCAILGKLVSKDQRDNSLRRVWDLTEKFLVDTEGCTASEAACIDGNFATNFGSSRTQSRALQVRNKVIAHNEMSLSLLWSDFDAEIRILGRVWTLLVRWCCGGILTPFRDADAVFIGLRKEIQIEELQQLKVQRARYLSDFHAWCTQYMDTGRPDPGPGPYAQISISFGSSKSSER